MLLFQSFNARREEGGGWVELQINGRNKHRAKHCTCKMSPYQNWGDGSQQKNVGANRKFYWLSEHDAKEN